MCCHRFATSDANALRTTDCEIPNCRAILDGVMPALKSSANGIQFPLGQGNIDFFDSLFARAFIRSDKLSIASLLFTKYSCKQSIELGGNCCAWRGAGICQI